MSILLVTHICNYYNKEVRQCKELQEVQQEEGQNSALRNEQPYAQIYAEGHPAGRDLSRKGGDQVEHETARAFTEKKTNITLGCMRQNIARRSKYMVFPLYSALAVLYMACSSIRDMDILDSP